MQTTRQPSITISMSIYATHIQPIKKIVWILHTSTLFSSLKCIEICCTYKNPWNVYVNVIGNWLEATYLTYNFTKEIGISCILHLIYIRLIFLLMEMMMMMFLKKMCTQLHFLPYVLLLLLWRYITWCIKQIFIGLTIVCSSDRWWKTTDAHPNRNQ